MGKNNGKIYVLSGIFTDLAIAFETREEAEKQMEKWIGTDREEFGTNTSNDYYVAEREGDITSYLTDPHVKAQKIDEGTDYEDFKDTFGIYYRVRHEEDGTHFKVMDVRYWLDTNYVFGDFSISKWALHKVTTDEDGEEEDEIILWRAYEDTPGMPDDNDDLDGIGRSVDDYIEKELGFIPDYEVG